MRKLFLIVLLTLSASLLYSQSPTHETTIGVWVAVHNEQFRSRVINELTSAINNNPDWNMTLQVGEWDTDVHLILSGMSTPDSSIYAWSITVTPIFAPHWTNGTAATSEANISGMNWLARTATEYLIEQLYAWYDATLESPTL